MEYNGTMVEPSGGVDLKEEIAKLKEAGVRIHPDVWDVMYLYLADYLSVINLCCASYLTRHEPISVKDGQKLQVYHQKSADIIHLILFPEKISLEDHQLMKIQAHAKSMGSGLRNLISHFVNNSLHLMGFILDDALDPAAPGPVNLEYTKKIYQMTSDIIVVLEEIRRELQEKDVGF
ncbi:MAG: hypothetical protein HQL13_02785 [Candidatus Omnitrophica bacterium]|nr:hypothetical protein [Candidatus Omnitrophota bacterium]